MDNKPWKYAPIMAYVLAVIVYGGTAALVIMFVILIILMVRGG